jgi:hypothetical protein
MQLYHSYKKTVIVLTSVVYITTYVDALSMKLHGKGKLLCQIFSDLKASGEELILVCYISVNKVLATFHNADCF